jgi:large subunit ribosomal protein L13
MKTFSAKPADVERSWHIIDAKNQIVGKVAVEAARLLRGKHKVIFTSHIDTGDFVIIVNAEQARFTGEKERHKIYARHSGYVGGQTIETPSKVRERRPELILEWAVKGMIPKTKLGAAQMKKLKIYVGESHPHEAQEPKPVSL